MLGGVRHDHALAASEARLFDDDVSTELGPPCQRIRLLTLGKSGVTRARQIQFCRQIARERFRSFKLGKFFCRPKHGDLGGNQRVGEAAGESSLWADHDKVDTLALTQLHDAENVVNRNIEASARGAAVAGGYEQACARRRLENLCRKSVFAPSAADYEQRRLRLQTHART